MHTITQSHASHLRQLLQLVSHPQVVMTFEGLVGVKEMKHLIHCV